MGKLGGVEGVEAGEGKDEGGIMLTVREALKMPVFEGAKLAAGKGGLDNVIRWVHIVDIPGAKYEWAKGGELLLTAGFGLRGDEERQKELVPSLVAKELAGIVISVGHYLEEVPKEMRLAGNRHDFPIITLPPETAFIDVTEAIFGQIVNRQYALQQRAEEIHDTLTDLVLEGASMQEVAEALASLLGRSITVEDIRFRVLATALVGEVDEARTRSVTLGRTPPDLAAYLREQGIYERMMAERRPLRLAAMPELGMTMERIVAPIIVAHQIMGYVWVIAGEHPLDDLDELAVGHAATVAALIMLKEQAVREAEMARRGDLIEQLLRAPDHPDPKLIERAHQLDFHLKQAYQVLMITQEGYENAGGHFLLERVEGWLNAERVPALVALRDETVVVILQGQNLPKGEAVGEQMFADLRGGEEVLLIGVGRAASELSGLEDSYNQARETLEVARARGRSTGVVTFDSLGMFHWLHHVPKKVLKDNAYLEAIRELARYDEEHDANLVETLEAFLDSGAVVREAAKRIFVHRNTLVYRLERIEEITGMDPRQSDCRLNLHIALKGYRLMEG